MLKSCRFTTYTLVTTVCLLQFVNNNQALATLPGDGVGQNLITLAPCAINQPHVHPRGTEIVHITQGKPCSSPTLSAQARVYCTRPHLKKSSLYVVTYLQTFQNSLLNTLV